MCVFKGLGGTGFGACPRITNINVHAAAAAAAYKTLIDACGDFAAKTEEALGIGLANLRQKNKFDLPNEHRYFF